MSKRVVKPLLRDILEAITDIEIFTTGFTFEQFLADKKTSYAVIRALEIIGEAVSRLPEDFKDSIPTVDWFRIRGMRNRLVHDYNNIDFHAVWEVRALHLQSLKKEVERVIDSLPD